jgi:hypothetical protein
MAEERPPAELGLSLSDLVGHVRDELIAIRSRPTSQTDPIMELTKFDLEVSVAVSAEGSAGLKFWVVNLGAEAGVRHVHKIKLTFEPYRQEPVVGSGNPGGGHRSGGGIDIEDMIRSIRKSGPGKITFDPPPSPGSASFPGPFQPPG